jgi:hypothetical protein
MTQSTASSKQYTLRLLFDSRHHTFAAFNGSVEKTLHPYRSDIELQIRRSLPPRGYSVSIKGPLEVVDKCHGEINKILMSHLHYRAVRLQDETGDEIRRRAYVVVARVEQRLRQFIGRAVREIAGFDWWASRVPSRLLVAAKKIGEKKARDPELLDPLESIQFEDLLEIVNAEVSTWQPDRPLSATDLGDLLASCESLEDLRAQLSEKTKKLSLWDDVFVKYFPDPEEWKTLAKTIGLVIEERHKVMHHRPMRYADLQNLRKWERDINKAVSTGSDRLTDAQLDEALALFKELGEAFRRQHQEQIDRAVNIATQYTIPPIDMSKYSPLGGIMAETNKLYETVRTIHEGIAVSASREFAESIQRTVANLTFQPPSGWQVPEEGLNRSSPLPREGEATAISDQGEEHAGHEENVDDTSDDAPLNTGDGSSSEADKPDGEET